MVNVELTGSTDYFTRGFDLIREPLNLCGSNRDWFCRRAGFGRPSNNSTAIVLGATPWLARRLSRSQNRVWVIDSNEQMLVRAQECVEKGLDTRSAEMQYVHSDWSAMPKLGTDIRLVVGDNAFSFLEFPNGWHTLCSDLFSRMRVGGRIAFRVLSVPRNHRFFSVDDLISSFKSRYLKNYTPIRARLLFDTWNPNTFVIDTQAALTLFESNLEKFKCLVDGNGDSESNDLFTMYKYDGANVLYYAPPIDYILDTIGNVFQIDSVHYGSYDMASYFPLIVAGK